MNDCARVPVQGVFLGDPTKSEFVREECTILFGDPAAIFLQSLQPAFTAYEAAREEGVSGSNRHLALATKVAGELFHFREHIPGSAQKTRSQVEIECPGFRLVADVANAVKHRNIDRKFPLVKKAEDIYEIYVFTRYSDNKGEYTDCRTTIRFNCSDGLVRNLDSALTELYNYWSEQLGMLKLINHHRRTPFVEPSSALIPRSHARPAAFSVMRELAWNQRIQMMIFENDKGFSVPMDLTGHDIRLRVYEPAPLVLDIFMRADQLAEPTKASIELTQEESKEYLLLRTAKEHNEFQQRIALTYKDMAICQLNSQLEDLGFKTRLS